MVNSINQLFLKLDKKDVLYPSKYEPCKGYDIALRCLKFRIFNRLNKIHLILIYSWKNLKLRKKIIL